VIKTVRRWKHYQFTFCCANLSPGVYVLVCIAMKRNSILTVGVWSDYCKEGYVSSKWAQGWYLQRMLEIRT